MEIYLFMFNRPTARLQLTIGFGNNLFQYCFARLLAEKNNLLLIHREIPEFNIPHSVHQTNPSFPTAHIGEHNYKDALGADLSGFNLTINGYFEDYEIFAPHLDTIRSWFPPVKKMNSRDLILHLRLQNRLVQVSHHKNHVLADAYLKGMEGFDFDRLHIITDAKKWSPYTREDIEEIQQEIKVGPNPPSNSPWVSTDQSLFYINTLIEGFEHLNPIVHCNNAPVIPGSGGLRSGHMDDFNFIRRFDKIMIFNSTFSWWAALLSEASQVGTWGPWKPNKGTRSKNLGKTNYPGWFTWGSKEDLYWNE